MPSKILTRLVACIAVVALPWIPAVGQTTLTVEPYEFEAQGETIKAELGRLTVPENRSVEGSRLIKVAFVRFPATTDNPAAPIVYLAGGPGGSGTGAAQSERFHMFMKLREVADVIAYDQRGTGMAEPNLRCEESLDLPLARPADWNEWSEKFRQVSAKCLAHWTSRGVDLSGYNTIENADDVDALRKALGLEKISLWGVSYGTHLGLTYIRRHGEHVERAVLAGVEGPDHTYKLSSNVQQSLEILSQRIEDDPQLNETIPDFLSVVETLLNDLETKPVSVQLPGDRHIVVGKFDFQLYLSNALGDSDDLRMLPIVVHDMLGGDHRRLARETFGYRDRSIGSAMTWMMDCASSGTAERMAQIESEARETLLGNAINFPHPDICSAWNAADLGEDFRSPIKSDAQVLFISGTLDARTPPSNAEEILAGFPNGQHLLVEDAGHDEKLFSATPGVQNAMLAFYRGEPDSANRVSAEPLEFWTRGIP